MLPSTKSMMMRAVLSIAWLLSLLLLNPVHHVHAFTSHARSTSSRGGTCRSIAALSMAASKGSWRQQHNDNEEEKGTSSSDWNCALSPEEIEALIRKRNRARRARNYARADDILAKLNKNYVYLDDKKKLWRADGNAFQGVSSADTADMMYQKAVNSKEISEEDEEYVIRKLKERTAAKLQKNYAVADDILDELRFLHNVVIDDKKKVWRVADPYKSMFTYGGQRLNNVPRDTLKQIEFLVKDRADSKKKKNYARADEILDVLRVQFGVRVDDTKKAWFFLPKPKEERDRRSFQDMKSKKKDRKKKKQDVKDKVSDWSVVEEDEGNVGAMPEGVSISDPKDDVDSATVPEGVSIIEDNDSVTENMPVPQSRSELVACTVPQLKDKLREAGLKVSGRKDELIDRLVDTP